MLLASEIPRASCNNLMGIRNMGDIVVLCEITQQKI